MSDMRRILRWSQPQKTCPGDPIVKKYKIVFPVTRSGRSLRLGHNIITHHHRLQSPIIYPWSRDNETGSSDLYQILEGASGHLTISDMERQTKEDFPPIITSFHVHQPDKSDVQNIGIYRFRCIINLPFILLHSQQSSVWNVWRSSNQWDHFMSDLWRPSQMSLQPNNLVCSVKTDTDVQLWEDVKIQMFPATCDEALHMAGYIN